MYITEPPSTVTALDVRTGLKLWTWSPSLPEHVVAIGLSSTSRGVAVLGDTVYIGTVDSHLVALDSKTGAVRWDVHVADNAMGYAMYRDRRWPSMERLLSASQAAKPPSADFSTPTMR